MKLQKMLSRKYKGKEYYKYHIVIPTEDIKNANLKEGDELISEAKNNIIVLKKK